MPQSKLFLESDSYRRRRMMDAVRMLPILCVLLWSIVPMMWPNHAADEGQTALSTAIGYLFISWAFAASVAFLLWRRLGRYDDMSSDTKVASQEPTQD